MAAFWFSAAKLQVIFSNIVPEYTQVGENYPIGLTKPIHETLHKTKIFYAKNFLRKTCVFGWDNHL